MTNKLHNPSLHITWRELACHDGTAYPDEFVRDGRLFILTSCFEIIRDSLGGKPLKILSAFRTPTYNSKIGGAKNSMHIQGRALDIACPANMKYDIFVESIRLIARTQCPEIKGIGIYPKNKFVHIDIRPTAKLITWKGNGAKDAAA